MHSPSQPSLPPSPEPLSRLLRQWGIAPGSPPPMAERLGSWFAWSDAIEISQVLTTAPGPAASARARSEALAWAQAEVQRLQAELIAGFEPSGLAPEPDDAELSAQLAPYLQHFGLQQRVMDSRIATLRVQLRSRLSRASDALARLAQLDAYLERAIAAPQTRALAGLAAVLEARARKHHADDPPRWRNRLGSDLQRLLRAELDQKLQAVLGLTEALNTPSPP